jgi:hypothetical protein
MRLYRCKRSILSKIGLVLVRRDRLREGVIDIQTGGLSLHLILIRVRVNYLWKVRLYGGLAGSLRIGKV